MLAHKNLTKNWCYENSGITKILMKEFLAREGNSTEIWESAKELNALSMCFSNLIYIHGSVSHA